MCDMHTVLNPSHRFQQANSSEASSPLWPALLRSDLDSLSKAVGHINCAATTTWFPRYGCVLLAVPPHEEHIQPAANDVTFVLVSLDNWSFRVHRSVHMDMINRVLMLTE